MHQAGESVEGNLLSVNETDVRLVSEENRNFVFPRAMVTKVSVSKGKKNHILLGGIVGFGLGAVIGAVETPSPPGCLGNDCYTRAENIAYTALGLGLISALVGAFIKTDHWVDVPLDRLTNTPPEATVKSSR